MPQPHVARVFRASPAAVKNYLRVDGANHYYAGQPELLAQAVSETVGWLQRNDLATKPANEDIKARSVSEA